MKLTAIVQSYPGYNALNQGADVRQILLYAQKSSASPPYLFGSSFTSMTGESSAPMVFAPVPTTAIFASVAAEMSGLNSQNTHVSSVGTLMKNLRDCSAITTTRRRGRSTGWGRSREKRQRPDSEAKRQRGDEGREGEGDVPGTRGSSSGRRRSLLRGRLLCRVARSHAHALVVCCGHGAAGNNASMVMIMTP